MGDQDETRPLGIKSARLDEDVEGHGGHMTRRATEDEDVEGHGGHMTRRATEDEGDVEGHFGQLKSPRSRGE